MSEQRRTLTVDQLAEFVRTGTGVLIRIADRLGPELADNWANNGRTMEQAFFRALVPAGNKLIWRTIKLGTHKDTDSLRKALESGGYDYYDAIDILVRPAFKVVEEERDISLVVVSGKELGFTGYVALADIQKRALELGLELCPAEVGPQLRLQYKEQPQGENLNIAMEPIADWDGSLYFFRVENEGSKPLLASRDAGPSYSWDSKFLWVFVSHK